AAGIELGIGEALRPVNDGDALRIDGGGALQKRERAQRLKVGGPLVEVLCVGVVGHGMPGCQRRQDRLAEANANIAAAAVACRRRGPSLRCRGGAAFRSCTIASFNHKVLSDVTSSGKTVRLLRI